MGKFIDFFGRQSYCGRKMQVKTIIEIRGQGFEGENRQTSESWNRTQWKGMVGKYEIFKLLILWNEMNIVLQLKCIWTKKRSASNSKFEFCHFYRIFYKDLKQKNIESTFLKSNKMMYDELSNSIWLNKEHLWHSSGHSVLSEIRNGSTDDKFPNVERSNMLGQLIQQKVSARNSKWSDVAYNVKLACLVGGTV